MPGQIVESHLLVMVKGIVLLGSFGSPRFGDLIRPGKCRRSSCEPFVTSCAPSAPAALRRKPTATAGTNTRQNEETLLARLRLDEDTISRPENFISTKKKKLNVGN